jgi:hypothetical protein
LADVVLRRAYTWFTEVSRPTVPRCAPLSHGCSSCLHTRLLDASLETIVYHSATKHACSPSLDLYIPQNGKQEEVQSLSEVTPGPADFGSVSLYNFSLLQLYKMRFFYLAVFASTATALSFPHTSLIANLFARKHGGSGGDDSDATGSGASTGQCPAVWTSISKQLTEKFLSAGQCNPDARAAIRLIFHDCGGS